MWAGFFRTKIHKKNNLLSHKHRVGVCFSSIARLRFSLCLKCRRMLVLHNFVSDAVFKRPKVNTLCGYPRYPSVAGQHILPSPPPIFLEKKRCFTRKNSKNISSLAKQGGTQSVIYSDGFFLFHPTVSPTRPKKGWIIFSTHFNSFFPAHPVAVSLLKLKEREKEIFFLNFEEIDVDTKRRSTKHTDFSLEKKNFLVKQLLLTKKKPNLKKVFFSSHNLLRGRPYVFQKKKKRLWLHYVSVSNLKKKASREFESYLQTKALPISSTSTWLQKL